MSKILVVAYTKGKTGSLTLIAEPWTTTINPYDINFVFAAARTIVQGLGLFEINPPDFTKLNFAKHAGYREFLKHITIHMLTTSDDTVYIPLPSMTACFGELQVNNRKVAKDLMKKWKEANETDYAAGALSGRFVEAHEKEMYPEAEYAIFHMRKNDQLSGIGDALFIGAYGKMGRNWAHYRIANNQFPSDESLRNKKGIVITGSSYSVYDTSLPWLSGLVSLLTRIYIELPRIKILGVCFGCHILASILGGETIKSPDYHFFYGVEAINMSVEFARDFPLFPLSTIEMSECHGDIVSYLPPCASLYGSSKTSKVEIWGIPGRILCFQGHAELCPTFLVNFHVDMMRSFNNRYVVEHYEELISEFQTRLTHIPEIRSLASEFLEA